MELNIKDHWDQLAPETKQWLLNNPGCVVLPRTVAEIIHRATGITPDADQHGQVSLSAEDVSFIHGQSEAGAGTHRTETTATG
ncbi:MAG TPA: hypothetical protein VJQ60_13635 [Arthrobacter sp.]|nr:hypothetical protein [Arthrobacter sp.]